MLNRLATLAAVCMLIPLGVAPLASADPPPPADPAAAPADPAAPVGAPVDEGPPPDNGIVASAEPGIVTTPDGWKLTVAATNETQLPIAPLTTAISSREYLVAATFTGTVGGAGKTKLAGGTLDTGYQIGCGIELGQVRLIGQAGISTGGSALNGLIPNALSFPISGTLEIHLKPGTVNQISVDKKSFKAAPVRVTLKDVHVKLDGCVGQSFLRSYATLTSSSADNDDVVAYYGVTKSV